MRPMLERRGRSRRKAAQESGEQAAAKPGAQPASSAREVPVPQQKVPTSTGPDEETVRIAYKDFRRRRNAGRWRRARPVLVAVLVLALVAGAAWVVLFSSLVDVRRIEVSGTSTLPERRVERVAQVPTGRPLARVDLDAIRDRVESIPAVRRAEVSRGWPHAVRIQVAQRTPVAVIDRGSGLQSVDAEGVLFGSHSRRPEGLPLVRTEPDTADEALVEAGRVISSLPAQVARRVATVEVASIDEIKLVLANGRRVLWGSAEDSEAKAEVLAVLLERKSSEIDVSVPGRPTTR